MSSTITSVSVLRVIFRDSGGQPPAISHCLTRAFLRGSDDCACTLWFVSFADGDRCAVDCVHNATCPFFKGPIYGVDHLNNVVAAGHGPIPAQSIVTQSNVQQLSGLDPATYLNQAAAAIGEPSGFLFWGPYGALSYLVNPAGSYPVTIDPSFATPFTRASTLGIQRQVSRDFEVSLDLYHKGIENILGVRQPTFRFLRELPTTFLVPS